MGNELRYRLSNAMASRKMTASELSQKTGIPKSSLSQYVNGYASPKADRIGLIAKALDVNEAWLLGYDVPPQTGQIPVALGINCHDEVQISNDEFDFVSWTAQDLVTEHITLPSHMIDSNLNYFALLAWTTLNRKGIVPDDVLVFEETTDINNGQMGCFCVDIRTVVGIYYKLDNGLIILDSADETDNEPIVIDVTSDVCFTIMGRYVCKVTV